MAPEDATQDTVIERIKVVMRENGWTQEKLGENVDYSQPGVGRILRGENKPSWSFLSNLAAALPDLDMNWLVRGTRVPAIETSEDGHVLEAVHTNGERILVLKKIIDKVVTTCQ